MKKLNFLLCVVTISISISSCGNQSNNGTSNNYTPSSQSNNESSEVKKVVNEEPKSNPIDRFVGRYEIVGENESHVEVLSDGRVLCCDNRRSDDKSFMGNVKLISNDAFVLSPYNSDGGFYYSGGTPEYRIINGAEEVVTSHSEGMGKTPAYLLVFDVKEKRMYTKGYNAYINRDVCGTEYMKLIR